VPTLLMTGDSDLWTPPSILRLQASHMPHAEMTIIREAGHAPSWEQPQAFNAALLDFLKRHSA
jgi:pimeloyl-ACP methyl ester carboxylesterase